ncbi:hypothetical protein WDU94_002985 [Cyamophila willieti]
MAPKAVKRKSNTSDKKYGPSEKRDFHVYDKVFAKMRGYPPWPAKITNIKLDTKTKSLKSKCEVYFYGSNQVGQCAFSDIHDYEANKDRFKDVCAQMKSLKASFLLGLQEIEDDNGPLLEEIEDGSVAKVSFDDSLESEEEDGSPSVKKNKISNKKEVTQESPDESVTEKDHEEQEEEKEDKIEELDNTPVEATQEKGKDLEIVEEPDLTNSRPQAPRKKSLDSEPSTKKSKKLASTPKNNKNSDQQEPNTINSDQDNKYSDPANNSDQHKAPASPPSEQITNPTLLQTECSLLALEKNIKESVGVNKVDFTKALTAMNSLLELDLTPLMLKKNPEVVDTFLKLQRYAGERVKSQLPPSTRPTFDDHTTLVRNLATRVLDKFSTLFDICPGRTFIETFRTEIVKFIKRTRDMTPTEVLRLTEDVS